MFSVFRSNRTGPTAWARRVALFALIALEMAVTLSPLLEPHHEAAETHIEQSGTAHHFLVHNEATCAVCTLRSMGALPVVPEVPIASAVPVMPPRARQYVAVVSRGATAHGSRAPPVVG